MKKKILYIVTLVTVSVGCFFIGKISAKPEVEQMETKTTLDLSNDADFDLACDFVSQIVDWNTDGEEMAIMTKDGYELYMYRSQDVYGNRRIDWKKLTY